VAGKKDSSKKKVKKQVSRGCVHIQNTFNNTIVTVTDTQGNALAWSSAGALKFRGAKKSTPFASQMVAQVACENAMKYGLREVKVFVNGPGFGREAAVRAVARSGLQVTLIKDVTGIPHNGCRPRKIRRI
jgi:small subunit ribosomal protein S11